MAQPVSQAVFPHSGPCQIHELKQAGRSEEIQVSGIWVLIVEESIPGFSMALPFVIHPGEASRVIPLDTHGPLHCRQDLAVPDHQYDEEH